MGWTERENIRTCGVKAREASVSEQSPAIVHWYMRYHDAGSLCEGDNHNGSVVQSALLD